MVRMKSKKAKGDEALKRAKQKVGRKKLRPATETRAEVHSVALRVKRPRDAAVAQPPAEEETPASRRRPQKTFAECISGTSHYRAAMRASSLHQLTRFLDDSSALQRLSVLDTAISSMLDSAAEVRSAALGVAEGALKAMAACGSSSEAVGLQITLRVNVALTHADTAVRRDAMSFLALLTSLCPSYLRHSECNVMDGGSQIERLLHYCIQSDKSKSSPAAHLLVRRLFLEEGGGLHLPLEVRSRMLAELGDVALRTWIARWTTLMENLKLHREGTTELAIEAALCIGDTMEALALHHKLTLRHTDHLRCMLRRVPVALPQLCRQGASGTSLAVAVASAVLPAASAFPVVADSVVSCLSEIFAQPSPTDAALRLLERAVRECPALHPALPTNVLSGLPAILEAIIIDTPTSPLVPLLLDVLHLLATVSATGLSTQQQQPLGTALCTIPKWIFFLRRCADTSVRQKLSHRMLCILWDALRVGNPAIAAVSEAAALPSMLQQLSRSDVLEGFAELKRVAQAAAFYGTLTGDCSPPVAAQCCPSDHLPNWIAQLKS